MIPKYIFKYLLLYFLTTFNSAYALIQLKQHSSPFYPAQQLLAKSGYLYNVNCNNLEIIDIHNPDQPQSLSQLKLESCPNSLQQYRNTLYIKTNAGFIDIIDVSNPQSPRFIQQYAPDQQTLSGGILKQDQGYLYLGTLNGLYILSLENPQEPRLIIYHKKPGGIEQIIIQANHLFLKAQAEPRTFLGLNSGLWEMDIQDPSFSNPPQQLNQGNIKQIFTTADRYLHIVKNDPANNQVGLYILDVSDPKNPKTRPYSLNAVDGIELITQPSFYQAKQDDYHSIIATINDGLLILDTSTPEAPILKRFSPQITAQSPVLSIDQNHLYLLHFQTYVNH